MKILFVNPPRSPENGILAHAPQDALPYIHKKLIGPPVGLLTVAAAVEEIADIAFLECKGEYDLRPGGPPLDELVGAWIDEHRPQMVAVTFICSEFPYGIQIFETAKRKNPRIVTVAGGLYTTTNPEEFASTPTDYICPGQSAHIFRELVKALTERRNPVGVGGLLINGPAGLEETFERTDRWEPAGADFILPNRSLIRPWLDSYIVGRSPGPSTYVFSSLGCPYRCNFCSIWPSLNGRYRTRSVESLIEEISELDEYPAVRFADANTIVDIEFIDTLFDRIISEGIRKVFIMDIRADTAVEHPDLIAKLARGGLKIVICGFESFRDEELSTYGKTIEADINEKAIEIFHDNGIDLRGNYVIPTSYGPDDFTALEEYASGHEVAYAGYTILTPMPGTPFHKQVADSIIDRDHTKYNFMNAVLPTKLPLEEFYTRVAALWKIRRGTDTI
jgi:hopanoid C-3 methylase